MWRDYENRKDKFMDELYDALKFEAEKKAKKLSKEMGKIKQVRDFTAKELHVHQLVNVKKMTYQKASEVMGVSIPRISAIIKNINKKSGMTRETPYINTKKESQGATS